MLLAFRPHLLPGPDVLVAQAAEQFDAGGRLTNEANTRALAGLMQALRTEAGLERS